MIWKLIRAAGLLAAVIAFSAATGAWAQGAFDAPGFDRALAAKELNTGRLFGIEGVVGAGVGLDRRGAAAVVVTTARPGVAGLPRSLDGVSVIVMVTGPISANKKPDCALDPSHPSCKDGGGTTDPGLSPTDKWPRPVPIGVSTGNAESCSSGTIGARVTDGTDVYALSNNHVYAGENNAAIGGDILQPGRFDTNCVADADPIGVLSDFVPIVFTTSASNTVDAAIALTDAGRLGDATPSDGYGAPNSTPVAIDADQRNLLGLAVQKYGRTTGLTRGAITIVMWVGNIGYGSGSARFVDQLIVQSARGPFLKAGDSGSLLVTDDGSANPVGLVFAGNSSGKIAIVNPIDDVLTALGVSIDGK